jgi:hypothetical protein
MDFLTVYLCEGCFEFRFRKNLSGVGFVDLVHFETLIFTLDRLGC